MHSCVYALPCTYASPDFRRKLAYTRVRARARTHARTYARMHAHTNAHTHARTHARTHTTTIDSLAMVAAEAERNEGGFGGGDGVSDCGCGGDRAQIRGSV